MMLTISSDTMRTNGNAYFVLNFNIPINIVAIIEKTG